MRDYIVTKNLACMPPKGHTRYLNMLQRLITKKKMGDKVKESIRYSIPDSALLANTQAEIIVC